MDTSNIDLLSLIGRDTKLKKVASTKGGEYHGACPFCGGRDRFRVQPNRRPNSCWACRQCGKSGDAIAYVQQRDNVDFPTALNSLGIGQLMQRTIRPTRPQAARRHIQSAATVTPAADRDSASALTDTAYQAAARQYCEQASDQLFLTKAGRRALEWLYARGLCDSVIHDQMLGYHPVDERATWSDVSVWLDRGIVIPWLIEGEIWRVNIRRPVGKPKYRRVAGAANGLYLSDALGVGKVALLVEGEFDALLIRRLVPDLINAGLCPVATGSKDGSRRLRWLSMLAICDRVLVAFDHETDPKKYRSVEQAALWWLDRLGDRAGRLVPTAHDVTDMYKAGQDVRGWIIRAIKVRRSNPAKVFISDDLPELASLPPVIPHPIHHAAAKYDELPLNTGAIDESDIMLIEPVIERSSSSKDLKKPETLAEPDWQSHGGSTDIWADRPGMRSLLRDNIFTSRRDRRMA